MPGSGFLYFKNAAPSGAATSLSLQDGGTAPTGALTATGWTVAKLAVGNFSLMAAGTKRASTAFATTDALGAAAFSAASSWRSELAYNGTFSNNNWTFNFPFRATTAASQQGRVNIRLWKSTNADGSGATQLTSSVLVGSIATSIPTGATALSTVIWTSPGNITFNNEYFWVQCEWEIRGVSSSNSGDVVFYVESQGTVQTPSFQSPPAYAQVHFRFRTDAGLADDAPTWAKAEDTAILAADYQNINYRLRVSVQNTGPGGPSNTWTLRYSRNGGAYTPITTSSSVVQAVDASTGGATGDLCTVQRLTSGAGTFLFGPYNESGTTGNVILSTGRFTEFEYALKVVTADVANNDTLDFQVFPNATGLITQTVTPRITVAVASGISGAGVLAAPAAAVAGTGRSASVGTGALAAGAAAMAGSGSVAAAAITGTGALTDGSAAVAGAGTSASVGTGSLVAGTAAVAGAGVSITSGTGVLADGSASLSGTGVSASTGTGSLVAEAAVLAGAGESASAGSGALVAGAAEIAGAGTVVAAGDGVAPGALLPLTLALVAGTASGEGQITLPPVYGRLAFAGTAPGADFHLWVSLQPGRATGFVDRREDATAPGAVVAFRASLAAGSATGDAVGYDNDLMMLLAA